GDKYVLETMRDHGLNFGGEQSGHVIMQDFAKTGDGLVTALQVLAMVLMIDGKASEALRPFELYPKKLINLNVKTKKPLESIAGLDQELSDVEAAGMRHLIRYSGTENKLRILLEGRDRDAMLERMERLSDFFRHALND
ncbi:MAG: phosphoglucosamine mutase, partial [Campylobacterales bacterium]